VPRRSESDQFLERFSAIKKRLSALIAQAYAEAELGALQAKVLRHVGRESRCSQAELARAIDSDPTLTSRTLAALVDRGLVRRQRSAEDRREYVLELTPAGRRVRDHAERLRAQILDRVVGALDGRDLADFERLTAKILAATAR
jgi:DNA-binding MarR family transcriptional regulator